MKRRRSLFNNWWKRTPVPKAMLNTQTDLRTEILAQLKRQGSDTSKAHGFSFYLYLPTEAAAHMAAQRLSQDYQVEVEPAATGTDWLCLAETSLTPDTAPLD